MRGVAGVRKGGKRDFGGARLYRQKKGQQRKRPGDGFFRWSWKKRAETELHYSLKYGKENKNTT